jgi:hypothetical protein
MDHLQFLRAQFRDIYVELLAAQLVEYRWPTCFELVRLNLLRCGHQVLADTGKKIRVAQGFFVEPCGDFLGDIEREAEHCACVF